MSKTTSDEVKDDDEVEGCEKCDGYEVSIPDIDYAAVDANEWEDVVPIFEVNYQIEINAQCKHCDKMFSDRNW